MCMEKSYFFSLSLSLISDTVRCWAGKRWHASHGQQNPGDHHPLPSPKGSLCHHKQEGSSPQSSQGSLHRAPSRQYSELWQRWGQPTGTSVPFSFKRVLALTALSVHLFLEQETISHSETRRRVLNNNRCQALWQRPHKDPALSVGQHSGPTSSCGDRKSMHWYVDTG